MPPANSWSGVPSSWACRVASDAVLQRGKCCLLVASSISPADTHLPFVFTQLAELLSVHAWARSLLNFFSEPPSDEEREALAARAASAHRHIAVSFVVGFKTLFWARALTPQLVSAFTHLFLFDSDLVVRPSEFDLVRLLRIGEAINASLLAPAPYGANPGMFSLGMPRCPESDACKCSPRPWSMCVACRQPMIEVKAPLFTSAAWQAVHKHLLSQIP